MNIESLEKNIDKFHKATAHLAGAIIGVPAVCLREFPVVVKKEDELIVYGLGKLTDTDFINPYVVNAAFSLELSLKLLHYLDQKKWKSGHNLCNIYTPLSPESKQQVLEIFNNTVKNSERHSEIFKVMNEQLRVSFSWDLTQLITKSSTAFEDWRYTFQTKKTTWFAGYPEIRFAVHQRIEQLKKC